MGAFSAKVCEYAATIDSKCLNEDFEPINRMLRALNIKKDPPEIEWVNNGIAPQITIADIDGGKTFVFGGWKELKAALPKYTSGKMCPINPYFRLLGVSKTKKFRPPAIKSATVSLTTDTSRLGYDGVAGSSPIVTVAVAIDDAISKTDGQLSTEDLTKRDAEIYEQYVRDNFSDLVNEYNESTKDDPSADPAPSTPDEALARYPYDTASAENRKVVSQTMFGVESSIKTRAGTAQQQTNYMENPSAEYVKKFSKQEVFSKSGKIKDSSSGGFGTWLKNTAMHSIQSGAKAWDKQMMNAPRVS